MNRKRRKAKLAEWQERRDRNPEQPLDEFMVMDAIARGYIDRRKERIRKSDGMHRIDLDLPAEVREWLAREAVRQGVTVEDVVRRLIAADRAYEATRAMAERSEKLYDRDRWGLGPWSEEADRVEFRHAGLRCLLHRTPMGNWCGYVAVPLGHPLYGRDSNDVDVRVHGGLICADYREPGEPNAVWWFGFACADVFDWVPAMDYAKQFFRAQTTPREDGHWELLYRDLAYVRRETESLAEQLAAVE